MQTPEQRLSFEMKDDDGKPERGHVIRGSRHVGFVVEGVGPEAEAAALAMAEELRAAFR